MDDLNEIRDRLALSAARWAVMFPISSWQLASGEEANRLAKAWGEGIAFAVMAEVVAPELERLRAHVLDIAAHATPYGDIPDDPGYVGTYLLTAGALHRALGTIGHTAPSCQAEAERDEQARDRHRWRTRAEQAEAERDALKAATERVRALKDRWTRQPGMSELADDLEVALDTPTPTEETATLNSELRVRPTEETTDGP